MSGGSKFSSEVPKGDAWGVENAVADAMAEFEKTGRSPIIACVALIGIKKITLESGDDGPNRIAVINLRRIEALTTDRAIRNGQKLVMQALEDRRGTGTMLPFEEQEILRMAFGGLSVADVEQEEQDKRESEEDERMDDPQRLRRHLVSVHGHATIEVEGLEWADVRALHDSDHERDPADGMPPHDPEWWEWRRVMVEAAESDAPATDPDENDPEAEEETDTPDVQQPGVPEAEFVEPPSGEGSQED